ncbi:MAG: hypothetical protein HWE14_06095 [Flavobacteriia bacterium]|nr:hypothetical protein [Flavobacteriia bacterium]
MKRNGMIGLFILLSVALRAQPDNPTTPAPLDELEILLLIAGGVLGIKALLKRMTAKGMLEA